MLLRLTINRRPPAVIAKSLPKVARAAFLSRPAVFLLYFVFTPTSLQPIYLLNPQGFRINPALTQLAWSFLMPSADRTVFANGAIATESPGPFEVPVSLMSGMGGIGVAACPRVKLEGRACPTTTERVQGITAEIIYPFGC